MTTDRPPFAPPAELAESLLRAQRDVYEDTLEVLADDGPVRRVAPPELPRPFLGLLVRAIALERSEGSAAARGREETLRAYHLDWLQRRRVTVLAGRAPPLLCTHLEGLFAEPLALSRMPRLAAALSALHALLWQAAPGLAFDPRALVLDRSFSEIFADCYYGGYAPPLYTNDQDLAALVAEGLPALEVFDRRLAGPLLHELTHLQRGRHPIPTPYLDECVAAALGARAMPSLIAPDEHDFNALVGAGWFVQVGEHLFHAFGFERVVAAHAGALAWPEVLPAPLLEAFAQMGWEQYRATRSPSFLGQAQRPEPWVKAIYLGLAGRDHDLRQDGLLEHLEGLAWVDVPPPAETTVPAPMRAAMARAFTTRPRLGPQGQWRVERSDPLPMTMEDRALVAPVDATGFAFRWVLGPLSLG